MVEVQICTVGICYSFAQGKQQVYVGMPRIRYICDISPIDKGLPFCSKRWAIIHSLHSLDT